MKSASTAKDNVIVTKEQVIETYKSAGSINKTAKMLGKSPASIRIKLIRWASRGEVELTGMAESPVTDSEQQVLQAFLDSKGSIKQTAVALGKKEGFIRRKLDVLVLKGAIKRNTQPVHASSYAVVA